MRTPPFVLLCLACFGALLGLRFALEPLSARVAAVFAEPRGAPEAVMALPPKPEGLDAKPPGEGGEGGAALLTLEACEAMAKDVRDVCLQAVARQSAARDPDHAVDVCAKVADAELREECNADVAETVAPVDRAVGERICEGLSTVKWRGQCHFGMGLALAETDVPYAVGRCERAEAFRDFCRHDVVGEAALVDLEAAVAVCAKEEGDALTRKTCWHGIGKYLARRSAPEAAAACARSTPDWRGNCFHGLGWGAAERDPDATLAFCADQGPYADNCRQGVAHQLKRFDPTRAVALCEAIATPAIRDRCLAFVTR